jgi:predicted nucleic acid-binding protein
VAGLRCLLDTNILLRLVQPDSPQHSLVRSVVDSLWNAGASLCYTSQNLAEFWNVCTRPADKNGFGFSIPETDAYARDIESFFAFLPDTEDTHRIWRRLLVTYSVCGVQVHDARLAAQLYAHDIRTFLTFNTQDFQRYPDVEIVHPESMLARLQSGT